MSSRSIALTAAVAAFALRAGAGELGYDPVLAELAAPLFARHCTACHGRQGRGDGPAVKALVKRPADLTAIAVRRGGAFPAGEIARFIDGRFDLPAHGSREMPIWGQHFEFFELTDPGTGGEVDLEEVVLSARCQVEGVALRALHERGVAVSVVAIKRGRERIRLRPGPDEELRGGDRVVAIGDRENLARLAELAQPR